MRWFSRIGTGPVVSWLRDHDPEWAATRRAARTAIVMPALFALCSQVIGSGTMATFAAFGSFAMLLLVEFTGPMAQRLRAQLGLAAAWAVLISLGTLVAGEMWLAVCVTVVVGFLVLFAGVVSSVLAGASTALLLGFVLPVASAAPVSVLPERLAGAGLAAAASLFAITLMWPRPAADPLTAPAARVCRAAAEQLRTDASRLAGGADAPSMGHCRDAADRAAAAAAELREVFDSTPYRPTGLSTGSRALVRLVDELTWLAAVLAEGVLRPEDRSEYRTGPHSVRRTAAAVLDEAAALLDDPRRPPGALRDAVDRLRSALADMTDRATTRLHVRRDAPPTAPMTGAHPVIGALDLSFRAQVLGFATLQITDNVAMASAAERRGWSERLLGHEPGAVGEPLAAARERAGAHLRRHSVWLHNSVRGALGLGIAVALANVTGVQHSFWVLFGTLSVLRSNALNTGQNALRAVGGTLVGSILGVGLLHAIGDHDTALWFLLPIAVLVAGIAPATIGFAAGQASFTVTLVILFNVGRQPDWHVALLRVQDIALGCAVSVLVGLLFWPRGAAASVDRALSEGYACSAAYLASAVRYAAEHCGTRPASAHTAQRRGAEAAAAARRLDDVFRTYLAERGPKPVPLADMTTLVTGIVGLRLAAEAVLGLWQHAQALRPRPDRAGVRVVLLGAAERVTGWYGDLAEGLGRHTALRDPLPRDRGAEALLVEYLDRDLSDPEGLGTDTAVRVIWTADHLDAARRLQPGLASAARRDGPPGRDTSD
ncbi:FUSC family protein [Streptomyces fructofermentans]|uniref:FUSC family protein n=1 Tax=Streptomyces fructofermentans TaxID=152141 RepID=UPI0033DAA03C